MPNNVAESDASLADAEEKVGTEEAAGVDQAEEEVAESDAGPDEAEEEEEVAEGEPGPDETEEEVAEGEAGPDEAEAAAALAAASLIAVAEEEKKKRRRLLILLLVLLALLICVIALFVRYLLRPEPLPDLLPVPVDVNYAPHYLFSIYGLEKPVGVALSPDGDRIYVTESGGERLIRMFDREGEPLGSFAPPRTRSAERSPVYLATDSTGRVFVTDRLQHSVFAYDREGNYLDTILSPDLSLSEYVSKHAEGLRPGAAYAFNLYEADVYYQEPGEVEQTFPAPNPFGWAPLGIRMDGTGNMLLTDVDTDHNTVRTIPAAAIMTESWQDFSPGQSVFGETGQDNGQLLFPNSAVSDSEGRIYVSDGNNGRVSVWDGQGRFLYNLGQGTGDGALSLPRGAAMDARDRLHVVDAVGQNVRVYGVSGQEPSFLYAFGDWGLGDGQFNYPNDIALDASGRLYIADRENNRIQVWSY